MKNIIGYTMVIGLIFCSEVLFAQTPLNTYQETAAINNPGIQAIFKEYEMVMQKVPQIAALPDPMFGFGYFISAVQTKTGPQEAVLSVSQSFPWFGKLDAQEQATTERAKAVLEKFNNERSKLNFKLASTYNSLYVLRSAIRITDENLNLLNTFKRLAKVHFESGRGSMVDVLRIEMELGELENQLQYLQESKQPLMAEFEQLLNTKLDVEVEFPKVLWSDTLAISKHLIMDSVNIHNPSILSLQHELLSYNQDVIAARKTASPSFTLGLNYTFIGESAGYTGNDNGKDAILPTLGVKIPLYRKKYNGLIREKEMASESVVLKKQDKANQLQTELKQGFHKYDDAKRRVLLYIKLKDYAQQAMNILVTEYSSAEANFEELIRINRKLLKYELELEKARAEQNTAVAYINYLMGK